MSKRRERVVALLERWSDLTGQGKEEQGERGQATRAGMRAGDVLLSVGKQRLESVEDLKHAVASLPAVARYWRHGKEYSTRLAGSPLGVVVDERSARAALRAWRGTELVPQRGKQYASLPGTRLEVETLARLVPGASVLVGSKASEQNLRQLADHDRLRNFRLLGAILKSWKLDADLVVLSACQTGLGPPTGGDGLLGFAHALLARGARSVMLSRWKVDDSATALLMLRFYENLLGTRDRTKPMGRARALAEAKKWLRTLPRRQAGTLVARRPARGSRGIARRLAHPGLACAVVASAPANSPGDPRLTWRAPG
jgi:hypothetical protein